MVAQAFFQVPGILHKPGAAPDESQGAKGYDVDRRPAPSSISLAIYLFLCS